MTKVKKFLQKWVVNNIGFKILSLVFAFVLWLVITNTIDPVTTRTITGIPVQILNEGAVLDGSRVYTVVSGDTATIVVSGNRSVVGSLTASDFEATADFAELSITNSVPINVELIGDKARFAPSVNISQKTNSMVVSLENMAEKKLNVEVQFTGEESNGLIVTDAVASPVRVKLHAPESVIKAADKAVAMIDYSEVTGDSVLSKDLLLYGKDGKVIELTDAVYLEPAAVNIHISTNLVKSVPIHITPYGTPKEGYELSGVDYSKENVTIRGTEASLSTIDSIILPSELLNVDGQDHDISATIELSNYLPPDVTIYGDTGTVTIVSSITKKEEETTTKENPETEETETETTTETETETETETTTETETETETEG